MAGEIGAGPCYSRPRMASPAREIAPVRRRGWLRRAIFQVHLWTGLAVGLYAVAISVSGSILVYAPQLGEGAHRDLRRAAASDVDGHPVLSPAQAVERVRAAMPGRSLLNVQVASEPQQAHVVGLLEQGEYRVVFVHPITGEVSPAVQARGTVIGWIERLHSNFFSGRPGRVANGIGALLLVLLATTGFVIWWPGRGQLSRALRIDWGAGWKRVVFDLHNALGAWLLVPVLVLAITGANFTWPQVYRDLVSRVAPVSRRAARPRSTEPTVAGASIGLDAVIAQVRQANPARPAIHVDLPGGASSPYVIVAKHQAGDSLRDSTTTFVNRYSGAVLEVWRAGQAETWGDTMLAWLGPLHTGHFGGPGIRAVWAVLGLAPAVLFVTGFVMWWNRLIVPRRRRSARVAANA